MTHSHDRTLLAALGFLDPDKKDQMHGLACQYLSESPQRENLVRFQAAYDLRVAELDSAPELRAIRRLA